MALPELRKAGYDDGLSTGCIAAGGSTDILIPPSIILVIYAAIAELSVPKLLAAGLIPGPGADRCSTSWSRSPWSTVRPHYAPEQRELHDARAHRGAARAVAVHGAVHRHHRRHLCRRLQPDRGGVDRRRSAPSCSASLGRRMSLRDLLAPSRASVIVSGVLFVIVIGANLFSFFIVQTHLPDLLLDGAQALGI